MTTPMYYLDDEGEIPSWNFPENLSRFPETSREQHHKMEISNLEHSWMCFEWRGNTEGSFHIHRKGHEHETVTPGHPQTNLLDFPEFSKFRKSQLRFWLAEKPSTTHVWPYSCTGSSLGASQATSCATKS